jgi:voltage-dependent potassium channel beta subunit
MKDQMEYRYLGNTGIKVSVFSYGNWLNSNKEEDIQMTVDTVKRCWEHGVNFFDTAEIYGAGNAEEALGKAIAALPCERKDIVVSTKLLKCGNGVNDQGLSRKHLIEGIKHSLKRLQMDYVDVVFAHRPDANCPLEETVRAFSWMVDQGLTFYWGTSEWEADLISRAIELCERLNLHKPIVEQPQYNMLVRDNFEKNYRRVFSEYGYGTTIWSPLASGILSGKYNDGEIPEGSRFDKHKDIAFIFQKYFGEQNKAKTVAALNTLKTIGEEMGYSQPQVALAWAIANRDVSTCLLGFSKIAQVDENMKSLELYKKWDKDIEKRIRDAFGNDPEPDMDWRTWAPLANRRDIHVSK